MSKGIQIKMIGIKRVGTWVPAHLYYNLVGLENSVKDKHVKHPLCCCVVCRIHDSFMPLR